MSVAQDYVEIVRANAEITRLNALVEKLVNMPEQQAEWLEGQNTKPGTEIAIGQLRQLGDLMRHAASPHPMDTGRVK
jgi:hypothetical protein